MRKMNPADRFAWLKKSLQKRPAGKALVPMAILMTLFLLPAICFSQKVTLNNKRIPLKQVFEEIKKQTNYDVIYNGKLVDVTIKVSVNAKDQPLEDFLKTVLAAQPVVFTIVGTTIVVRKEEAPPKTSVSVSLGLISTDDNQMIEGIALDDETRIPLSGASIVNKRTGKGTQTDAGGKFYMKDVERGDQITCSMIGYQSVTVPAGKMSVVLLKVAVNELDKAVIQAYGKTSKRLATGDITRISGEEIARQPVMNPMLALQGRVPGMIVTPTTGYASSPVKVNLMGRNSLNKEFSGEPLYIIDGVPQTILDLPGAATLASNDANSPGYIQDGLSKTAGQSPLYGINPKEIESIEVLKDGDATAIYGSRGANGVILITTRKAKPGKTSFSVGVNQGIVNASRRADVLNTRDYLKYRREAFKNDGILPTTANAPDLMLYDTTRYTNWQDVLYRTGLATGINAAVAGGDIRNSFRLGMSYNMEKGMMVGKGKNETIAMNLSTSHASLDQKLRVLVGVQYRYMFVNAIGLGGSPLEIPNAPAIYDSVGNPNFVEWKPNSQTGNYPFSESFNPNVQKTNSFSTNADLSYKVLDGLTVQVSGGFTSSRNTNDFVIKIISQDPRFPAMGTAVFSNTNASTWIVEPKIQYRGFAGKGSFDIMVGGTLQSSLTNTASLMGFGYSNDDLIGSISNASFKEGTDASAQNKYVGVFTMLNYNWQNKYIFNINARRDGSSRFAPGRQFGNFGSVGASWNLSEEEWIKKGLPSWISFLKIRGSYGITGLDAVGDYQYLARWGVSTVPYSPLASYNDVQPYTLLQPVNQVYHWEGTRKLSAGLDISLFDGRINITATTQRNIAHNQLVNYPTPLYTGFPNVKANSPAKVLNVTHGLEISAVLFRKNDFELNAAFNIGTTRNKLLAYPGLELSPHASLYQIGESLSSEFLLHYLGVNPLTGEYSFEDHNKNGWIDIGPGARGKMLDDRYVAINLDPKYDGGFRTDMRYRNASLALNFSFRRFWKGVSFLTNLPGRIGNIYVPSEGIEDYWKKPGDNARYARLSTSLDNNINVSDGNYMDIFYLRLNNISFSYSLAKELIKKAGMSDCSFGFTISNIFTIGRYPGLDPLTGLGMPSPRHIQANLSFTF